MDEVSGFLTPRPAGEAWLEKASPPQRVCGERLGRGGWLARELRREGPADSHGFPRPLGTLPAAREGEGEVPARSRPLWSQGPFLGPWAGEGVARKTSTTCGRCPQFSWSLAGGAGECLRGLPPSRAMLMCLRVALLPVESTLGLTRMLQQGVWGQQRVLVCPRAGTTPPTHTHRGASAWGRGGLPCRCWPAGVGAAGADPWVLLPASQPSGALRA